MANENQNIIGAGQDTAHRAPKTNTITCGDCLEVMQAMPDKSVDIVITSPPYNLSKKASGGGNSKRDYNGWYSDEMPEDVYQSWQSDLIRECLRVSRGSVFYNHRIRYAWHSRNKYRTQSNLYHPWDWISKFPVWSEIVWWRKGTTGHVNNRFRLADERIYQIGKPHYFHDCGYTSVWEILPCKNEGHPCSFPVELPLRCINTFCPEGGLVLDPFMGSGTTAIACLNAGKNFIGIEKEEKYCRIAEERIHALKSPAQNVVEICHTAPNSESPKAAQVTMELGL